jgi:hypothetical protein
MTPAERQSHTATLQASFDQKSKEQEAIVDHDKTRHHIASFGSDIQQLGWRLEYLAAIGKSATVIPDHKM